MVQRKEFPLLLVQLHCYNQYQKHTEDTHLQDTIDFINFIEKIKVKKPNVAERFFFRFEKCLD